MRAPPPRRFVAPLPPMSPPIRAALAPQASPSQPLTEVSRHRLGHAGQLFDERSEHVVGARATQLVLAVVTTRDPYTDRTRGVCRGNVFRGIPENEHALRVELRTQDFSGPIDRLARQLATVGRGRAVAAEREEAVQVGAGELDVGRCLYRTSRDPTQEASRPG